MFSGVENCWRIEAAESVVAAVAKRRIALDQRDGAGEALDRLQEVGDRRADRRAAHDRHVERKFSLIGVDWPRLRGSAQAPHQSQPLEAHVPLAADDQVVVHGDAERLADLDDGLRHLDVGARGRRVAGGMVVHEDDGGRGKLERAADHLARIDRRVVDRAGLLHLVGEELVLLVEEEDAELLALLVGHGGAAIVEKRRPGGEHACAS